MDKNWKVEIVFAENETLLPIKSRNRRKIHRRPRSMLQAFIIGSICITVVFLLLYIPLFSHYNARICKLPKLILYRKVCFSIWNLFLVPLSNWGYNISRNTSDYVLPNEQTVMVQPRNVCDSSNNFFLLIMVSSALGNFQARFVVFFFFEREFIVWRNLYWFQTKYSRDLG